MTTHDVRPTAPPPPGGPTPRSTGGTVLVVLAVIAAVAAVASGSMSVVGSLARETESHDARYDGVRTLDVRVDNGAVEVVGTDDPATTVDRSVSWSLDRPDVSERLSGSRLTIRVNCGFSYGRGCGGHLTVRVPRETRLLLHSGGGRVEVSGVDGRVEASSSDGAVLATDVGGPLLLRTSDGRVEGHDLRSASVRASTSDGRVLLELAEAPDRVQASTRDGSIEVVVPADGTTYRVDSSTADGSEDIAVRNDPAGSRRIDVRTDDGSVTVRYAG